MSITQPDDRVTSYAPAVPTTTFAADFPVFDNSDLVVIHNGVERYDFTVQATYIQSISNDARVVFDPGLTGTVLVVGARKSRRSSRFGPGPINANMLNAAFDTAQGELQEARRDIDRSVMSAVGQPGQELPTPETGLVLGWSFGKLVNLLLASTGLVAFGAKGLQIAATATLNDALAAVGLPTIQANRMLVDNAAGTARESKTFDEVKALIDPDSEVLRGQGLKLTYHKARSSWHVKAFGASLTDVGGGNASVDTAALQAAVLSEQNVDMTGALLRVNDVISIPYSSANISSVMSSRIGDRASSKITVVDAAQPKLFNVSASNFECSGFFVDSALNSIVTLWHYERPAGSAVDIDAALSKIGTEGGGKIFHHYGRGLKLEDSNFANTKIAIGDLDFPASWTPNGQSSDTQETAMRAYQFSHLRFHGAASGIRNVGANALNCGGIQASDIHGDIGVGGGGAFVGVFRDSQFINIMSRMGATIAGGILDLYDGSENCKFANIGQGGFRGAATSRLVRNPVVLRPGSIGIRDIDFIGGVIGPCNRNGLYILGSGRAQNIGLTAISFDRPNIEGTAYFPIKVEESGGSLLEVTIKLNSCNFRFGAEVSPSFIVGGLNSAVVQLLTNSLTTKPASIAWKQSNVLMP